MKKKLNIGDRVKVNGKAGVIRYISDDEPTILVEFDEFINGHSGKSSGREYKDGHCWWYNPEAIEKICPDKLIFKGNETILIKDGKEYVSKCADGDVYDKEKGLLLCLAKANGVSYEDLRKMIDGAEDKNKEMAVKIGACIKAMVEAGRKAWEGVDKEVKALKDFNNANVKPEAEKTVKEVKRPAKVGEYIKIVKAFYPIGGYKDGDILRVEKRFDFGVRAISKAGVECLPIDSEYVVLENYKPYKITLSEFWKSKDKLGIHYKGKKKGKQIFDLMIEKGFCCETEEDHFCGDGVLLNDKNCGVVKINEQNLSGAKNAGYKIYEADEVDLNN